MERVFECTIFGATHRFLFTAAVKYDAMDRYGVTDFNDIIEFKGRQRIEAICYLATEMAKEAGEEKVYDWKTINPLDATLLETSVLYAIVKGGARENKPAVISKTLEAIEKKKEDEQPAPSFWSRLLRALGFRKTRQCTPPSE